MLRGIIFATHVNKFWRNDWQFLVYSDIAISDKAFSFSSLQHAAAWHEACCIKDHRPDQAVALFGSALSACCWWGHALSVGAWPGAALARVPPSDRSVALGQPAAALQGPAGGAVGRRDLADIPVHPEDHAPAAHPQPAPLPGLRGVLAAGSPAAPAWLALGGRIAEVEVVHAQKFSTRAVESPQARRGSASLHRAPAPGRRAASRREHQRGVPCPRVLGSAVGRTGRGGAGSCAACAYRPSGSASASSWGHA